MQEKKTKKRTGRPATYHFRPDSELSENELLLKQSILNRRQQQNRYYHRKKRLRAAETGHDSGESDSQRDGQNAPRTDQAEQHQGHISSQQSKALHHVALPEGNAPLSHPEPPLDTLDEISALLRQGEEDAVVADILGILNTHPGMGQSTDQSTSPGGASNLLNDKNIPDF